MRIKKSPLRDFFPQYVHRYEQIVGGRGLSPSSLLADGSGHSSLGRLVHDVVRGQDNRGVVLVREVDRPPVAPGGDEGHRIVPDHRLGEDGRRNVNDIVPIDLAPQELALDEVVGRIPIALLGFDDRHQPIAHLHRTAALGVEAVGHRTRWNRTGQIEPLDFPSPDDDELAAHDVDELDVLPLGYRMRRVHGDYLGMGCWGGLMSERT